VDTYYEYLRTFSQELGARIVEMYPPLQGPNDTLPASLMTLLRQPLPAQVLTISGVAKHLKTARSAIIVGECGTGKTLMSVAVAHAVAHTHSEGRPYTAIGMCPPHLVFKWAREVLETIAASAEAGGARAPFSDEAPRRCRALATAATADRRGGQFQAARSSGDRAQRWWRCVAPTARSWFRGQSET
jgi:hypothetical protein